MFFSFSRSTFCDITNPGMKVDMESLPPHPRTTANSEAEGRKMNKPKSHCGNRKTRREKREKKTKTKKKIARYDIAP